MNWEFAYPELLYTLLVIPTMWIVGVARSRRRRGITVSTPSRVGAAGRSWRVRTRWIPILLISFAMAGLIFAMARPRESLDSQTVTKDTIALELVIDRSGSMEEPVIFDGVETSRLEAVKQVVERFVVGDGQSLSGRTGDLLGLIVFGTYADTLMPLTQSHDVLVDAIRRIELPQSERERNTAIGDALMLAAARLKATEDAMVARSEHKDLTLKSKAIILLTDGENRAGAYSPIEAAELAKEWGIKVYIIGIRGGTGRRSIFGGNMQAVNDQRMQSVAETTGGQYWGVDRIGDLEKVYAQIDQLERSSIEVTESTSYRELYIPIAILGMCMYVGGVLLRLMFYRSVS